MENRVSNFDFSLEDIGFKERLWKQLKDAASVSEAKVVPLTDDEMDLVSAAGETEAYIRSMKKKENEI